LVAGGFGINELTQSPQKEKPGSPEWKLDVATAGAASWSLVTSGRF